MTFLPRPARYPVPAPTPEQMRNYELLSDAEKDQANADWEVFHTKMSGYKKVEETLREFPEMLVETIAQMHEITIQEVIEVATYFGY